MEQLAVRMHGHQTLFLLRLKAGVASETRIIQWVKRW